MNLLEALNAARELDYRKQSIVYLGKKSDSDYQAVILRYDQEEDLYGVFFNSGPIPPVGCGEEGIYGADNYQQVYEELQNANLNVEQMVFHIYDVPDCEISGVEMPHVFEQLFPNILSDSTFISQWETYKKNVDTLICEQSK